MKPNLFAVSPTLRLLPIDVLPTDARPVEPPEQLIDTVVLRNIDLFTKLLFGQRAAVLFHSTFYWGPADVGCVLADGQVVLIENKGRRPVRKEFERFRKDVSSWLPVVRKYVRYRYDEMCKEIRRNRVVAERMFAGYFLRKRIDTIKDSHDLVDEVCQALSLARPEFAERFRSENHWLETLQRFTK
ncbi:MAG: hypothetical protein WBC44_06535 [Planctomycetaceae bacterium]